MNSIISSWASATNLDYSVIKGTFSNQTISNYYMNENNHEDYMNAHRKLSEYALAGIKVSLGKGGDFICSEN